MSALERCVESLAVCHLQDERHWPAARVVARQDIDAYLREAGPGLAEKREAMTQLSAEFARKFPEESDPVLIRSYMRRIIRRIEYDLLENRPAGSAREMIRQDDEDMAMESEAPMTEQQRLDLARLCRETNVPDRSGDQLSAEAAQQIINELREKAAELIRK